MKKYSLVLTLLLTPVIANAIIIDSGANLVAEIDVTGVGFSGNLWGTLISDNVIVSANHYHPTVGNGITFTQSGGGTVAANVSSGFNISGTDIWLGTLDNSISGVTIYDFWNQPLTESTFASTSALAFQEAYLLGYSSSNLTVGKNVLDSFLNLDDGTVTAGALVADRNILGDANYLADESYLQSGDSGGPMFVNIAGEQTLVGLNWAIGWYSGSGGIPDFNAFSYLGNEASEIDQFILDNSGVIPEPSTYALIIGAACLGFVVWKRRRRTTATD